MGRIGQFQKGHIPWQKGRKLSEKQKLAILNANIGRKHSAETKKKIGDASRGRKHSDATKAKMSKAGIGRKFTDEWKQKIGDANRGRKCSEETKAKMSKVRKGKKFSDKHRKRIGDAQRGEKGNNWQGGLSFKSYPFEWTETLRESIRQRDGYKCQLCSKAETKNSRKLSIHHINYIKEHLDPENLITLCVACNAKVNFGRTLWMKYFRSKIRIQIAT